MTREEANSTLQKISEIVSFLQETMSNNNTSEWMYLTTDIDNKDESKIDTSVSTLYSPRAVYKRKFIEHCDKCNDTGLIRLDDTFRNHYKRCECRKLYGEYIVDILSVDYYDTENELYVCKGKKIPCASVCDEYTKDHKSLICYGKPIFYLNIEDAEKCVEELMS